MPKQKIFYCIHVALHTCLPRSSPDSETGLLCMSVSWIWLEWDQPRVRVVVVYNRRFGYCISECRRSGGDCTILSLSKLMPNRFFKIPFYLSLNVDMHPLLPTAAVNSIMKSVRC